MAAPWLRGGAKVVVEVVDRLPVLEAKVLLPACPATASSFQADIDRLSGVAPLDAAGTIASRHTGHSDNARVVDALIAELRAIGYCPWREPLSWYGQTRYNVIADLPGQAPGRSGPTSSNDSVASSCVGHYRILPTRGCGRSGD